MTPRTRPSTTPRLGALALAAALSAACPARRPAPITVRTMDGMVRVTGGTFTMGADAEGERPTTRVTLRPYWIDRVEVSVARYRRCVEAGRCEPAPTTVYWPADQEAGMLREAVRAGVLPRPDGDELRRIWSRTCNWGKTGRDEHPINCVTWAQAKAYCESLGRRLPTEAEWEFAARGPDGRRYPWGNEAPDAQRVAFDGEGGGTSPVEGHPAGASPFGALNMSGNVWEWTADAWAEYPGGRVSNPSHPDGHHRVSRGGGWDDDASMLHATQRSNDDPMFRGGAMGIRCARDDGR